MKHSKEAIDTFNEALRGTINMANERPQNAVALSDLLTAKQIQEVLLIMQHEADPIERVQKLKAYLQGLEMQLINKGVVPAYLAYLLEYHYGQNIKPKKESHG